VGLLVARQPAAAFDAAVLAGCAALAGRSPRAALAVVLVVRATFATSVLFDLVVLGAGALALLAVGPGLTAKRVTLPLFGFLLLALPSVPLLPSFDEGLKPEWLQLPVLGFQYLRNPSSELLEWIRLATVLVAFLWAVWCVRTPQRLRWLVAVVLASAAYPVASALYYLAGGRTHYRAGGFASVNATFVHPNYFASYLMIVMVLAVVAFLESRSLAVRTALSVLLAGGLVCLFFTYTRTAWIGFAGALLVVTLLRYRRLAAIGAVALVVVAVAVPAATHKAEGRFADLSHASPTYQTNSWAWRKEQWRRMVPYGLERPITGRGFGSYFRDTVAVFGLSNRDFTTRPIGPTQQLGFGAHNDYVKALVETGVAGLILWVSVLAGLVSVAVRARTAPGAEPYATAMLGVTLALAGMSLADNVEASAASIIYAFVMCGALAGVTAERRRAQAPA
jgi:putative inorganic carbon (hco3(-)) transporter